MTKYIICYGATLLTLLVIDGIWLGFVAKGFYQSQIGHLMAERVNFIAAGLFYVIYPAGVVYFAGVAGLESGDWRDTAMRAAMFGFVAYSTYDLSNWATLKDWPAQFALVDILWGAAVTTVSATVGMIAAKAV